MSGMSTFAKTIFENKYAHTKSSGRKEEWDETSERVIHSVVDKHIPEIAPPLIKLMKARKFIPGGRYLYAAGRRYQQFNSCFLLSAEDSREGWSDLMGYCTSSLMTGGGIGTVYSKLRGEGCSIGGLGGKSTGPCALMNMVNESGRYIVQGGSRRSAIWAGLHWYHPDVEKFIRLKNWDEYTREGKRRDFNFPALMDGTNISVILDDDFFEAYRNPTFSKTYHWGSVSHTVTHKDAHRIYWYCIRSMMETGEPGFSVDIGPNTGHNLRNAPISGDTFVLVSSGDVDFVGNYTQVKHLLGRKVAVWTGQRWVMTEFKKTRENVPTLRIEMTNARQITCTLDHEFLLLDGRRLSAGKLRSGMDLKVSAPNGLTTQERVQVLSVADGLLQDVYCCDVGVEEHSFMAEGVIISNCTEVTSDTNLDMCNLASLSMARFDSIEEFAEAVRLCTAFLICGTLVSQLPIEEMYEVREKNRRLGLGLMGVHEWILQRGLRYESCDELGLWMEMYATSGQWSRYWADKLGISRPVATRSIAPVGTISIVGETTSGIEPLFAAAYKRRYLDGKTWKAQYVVDATAKRIVDNNDIDPDSLEDAMTLAEDFERRIRFQAWMQGYVDHGISSTINLPEWGSVNNNESKISSFGNTMMSHLPKLRGITAYPNGARDGQPLVRCPYSEAIGKVGVEFVDNSDKACMSGVCGT